MKSYRSIMPALGLLCMMFFVSSCEEENISSLQSGLDANLSMDAQMLPDNSICETIDFEQFEAGDIISSVDVLGGTLGVFGQSPKRAENSAMIFDSSNPTGGDPDLGSETLGNILIVSEDLDSSDPDDEGNSGAKLFFDASGIDGTVYFTSIDLKDIEEDETGEAAYIRIYDADGVLLEEKLLDATGDGGEVTEMLDYVEDGVLLEVDFLGSGGIDNLVICIIDVQEDGCSRTLGYYKNIKKHLAAWCTAAPTDEFYGSGYSYLQVLKAPVDGDPYLNLAQQFIAATQNECNNAPTPLEVDDALAQATMWFEMYDQDDSFWDDNRDAVLDVKDTLDAYNNGELDGTIHCDDLEEDDD